jgi:hypothetical protein
MPKHVARVTRWALLPTHVRMSLNARHDQSFKSQRASPTFIRELHVFPLNTILIPNYTVGALCLMKKVPINFQARWLCARVLLELHIL